MNRHLNQSIPKKDLPFIIPKTSTLSLVNHHPRIAGGRFAELNKDKLRGDYYTSSKVAAWLCAWAIRTPNDRVLKPSCGDGIFLEATIQRFIKLGGSEQSIVNQLIGLEIIPEEADKERIRLEKSFGVHIDSKVETIDFSSWWQQSNFLKYDAVVGNPPFIRYQAEIGVCDHRHSRVVATFPERVNAPVQYGERVKAMAIYLNHQQLIPEDRLFKVFRDLFDLPISTSTIVKMGQTLAAKVKPYLKTITDYLKGASVKNVDETGFRIGGNTRWLHVLSNSQATVYRASQRRSEITEGLKGVVCHDYFRPYFRLKGIKHALCNAHILWELKALIEHDRESWAQQMSRLLTFVVQIAKDEVKIRRYKWRLSPNYDEIVEKDLLYHEGLTSLPQKRKGKQKRRDGHNLLLRLKGHKEDVLRCLDLSVPGVPFTNNQAEQDIRMMKVKQKISGGFRTMEGAETFAMIRSFLSTMRKQGHNLFDAITAALTAQPPPLRL